MRISDLFRGNQGIDQSFVQKNESAQSQEEQAVTNRSAKGKPAGEDSISISPLARQLATIQKVVSEEELTQQQRVAGLKQQVESGTYNVSADDVANSLIAFAQE